MNNLEIRTTAMQNGIKHWEIADAIGITECHFSRKLRKELPEKEKEKVLNAIRTIIANRKQEG